MGRLRRATELLAHAVVFELTMYRNLLRWIIRRPCIGPGDEPAGYAQLVTPVMSLWIFASAAEMPLVHILLPWRTAQIISIALGVWTLVWMFGALAGLRIHPHLLSESSLRVRNGAFVDIRLPWDAIASVTTKEVDLSSSMKSLQPLETDAGTDLRVGVSGRVNIQTQLRTPLAISTRKGTFTVSQVSFWVDEPRRVAARVRERAQAHTDV
ncbi:MAG TPA: hypothetical protein VFJ14_13400 [Nocardioidaceae bacterium]|nr:hypothetical protein [Nocardioidaceae bacterium]